TGLVVPELRSSAGVERDEAAFGVGREHHAASCAQHARSGRAEAHGETPANVAGHRIDRAYRSRCATLVILLRIAAGERIARLRRDGFARVIGEAFAHWHVKQAGSWIVRR